MASDSYSAGHYPVGTIAHALKRWIIWLYNPKVRGPAGFYDGLRPMGHRTNYYLITGLCQISLAAWLISKMDVILAILLSLLSSCLHV